MVEEPCEPYHVSHPTPCWDCKKRDERRHKLEARIAELLEIVSDIGGMDYRPDRARVVAPDVPVPPVAGPRSRRKVHVIKERHFISGFQPDRWIECRCGWKTSHHYSARAVLELFRKHQEEMEP